MPAAEHRRMLQLQPEVEAVLREEPRTFPDDHRELDEVQLISQLVLQQPAGERSTADEQELAGRLGLEFANPGGDVTRDHGGVLPGRIGQRVRDHVLRLGADRLPEPTVVAPGTPERLEQAERPAAEQERIRTAPGIEDVLGSSLVVERERPAAACESGVHLLVVPSIRLCDSVQGDLQADREFHCEFLSLTSATNGEGAFRQRRGNRRPYCRERQPGRTTSPHRQQGAGNSCSMNAPHASHTWGSQQAASPPRSAPRSILR